MKYLFSTLLGLSAFGLVACGGGGSTPAPVVAVPDFAVVVDETQTDIGETETVFITLYFEGAQGNVIPEISFYGDETLFVTETDFNNKGGTVTVTANELGNDSEVTAEMNFTDSKGNTEYVDRTFNLINTSGTKMAETFDITMFGLGEFIQLKAEHELYERVSKLAVMNGVSRGKFDGASIEQRVDTDMAFLLNERFEQRENMLNDYRNGLITEASLGDHLAETLALATEFVKPANELIETALMSAGQLVPVIKLGELHTYNRLWKVSQFIGNQGLGEYADSGEWVFGTNYQFLNTIVFSGLETCNVE